MVVGSCDDDSGDGDDDDYDIVVNRLCLLTFSGLQIT